MQVTHVNIEDLKPAEYNPRRMTEKQAKDLKDSILEFGLVDPLLVNEHPERKNVVIGGHQRLEIAKKIGLTQVPVVYVNLSPEKEKELNLRLNKNVGEWDFDILANEFDLSALQEIGFSTNDLKMNLDKFGAPPDEGGDASNPGEEGGQIKNEKFTTCPKCGHEFNLVSG